MKTLEDQKNKESYSRRNLIFYASEALSRNSQRLVDNNLSRLQGVGSLNEHAWRPLRLRMIEMHKGNNNADKNLRLGQLDQKQQVGLFQNALKDFNTSMNSGFRKKFNQKEKKDAPRRSNFNNDKESKNSNDKKRNNKFKDSRGLDNKKPKKQNDSGRATESAGSNGKNKSKFDIDVVKGEGKRPDLIKQISDDPTIANDCLLKAWRLKQQDLKIVNDLTLEGEKLLNEEL